MTAALVTPAQIFREASIVTTAKTDMKNSAIVASQRTGAQQAMSAPIPTPFVAQLLFPMEAILVTAI